MRKVLSATAGAWCVRRHGIDVARASRGVHRAHGLPSSLYTDRGSHYFHTPQVDGPVDKDRLTQVGRALMHLGVEHIPAYSPEARGRSERMFATLQDHLIKELAKADSPRSTTRRRQELQSRGRWQTCSVVNEQTEGAKFGSRERSSKCAGFSHNFHGFVATHPIRKCFGAVIAMQTIKK
jgi:hypothetical protein